MPTSVLTTIIAVTSTRSVAILWDRTHAHVKEGTQEMGGLAMVRLFVSKRSHCTAIGELWVELHKTYTLVVLFQRSFKIFETVPLKCRLTDILVS